MAGFSFVTNDGKKSSSDEKKVSGKVILGIVIAVLLIIAVGSCFKVVSEGYVGVKYRFGKIVQDDMQAGLNFMIPFAEEIIQVDVREQIYTVDTDAYTSDTQTVENLRVKLNYYYDRAKLSNLVRTVGIYNVEARYIIPQVQSIVKNEIGQYRAENLINNRSVVQNSIGEKLKERLEPNGIIVASFAIENIDFESGFEEAVRAKVVAEQDALKMQNKTKEREEEAKQVVIAAQADADAAKLKADADAYTIEAVQKQLNSSPQYLEYVKLQRWNGILPQAIGETINPFIVLDDNKSANITE